MEDQINSVEALFKKTTDYLETRIELVKLQTVNKITDVVSSFVSMAIVMIIIVLMVVVLNIGIALWLGEILGKFYYGFFCVAGFYLLLAVVLIATRRNWLKRAIGNKLVRKMLN